MGHSNKQEFPLNSLNKCMVWLPHIYGVPPIQRKPVVTNLGGRPDLITRLKDIG